MIDSAAAVPSSGPSPVIVVVLLAAIAILVLVVLWRTRSTRQSRRPGAWDAVETGVSGTTARGFVAQAATDAGRAEPRSSELSAMPGAVMSRAAMEQALDQLPEPLARRVVKARPFVLEIASDIHDDILGILCAANYGHTAALVVTSTRIIEVGHTGAMQILPYSETTQILFAPGKKKVFGGHNSSHLYVNRRGYSHLPYILWEDDHEWNVKMGAVAEAAFQRYRLINT
jgi:hypothetical protein